MYEWLNMWAEQYGSHEALCDNKGSYSYESLNTSVKNLSIGFADMGLRKSDKVIMEITKETTMGEMLAYDEKIAYILMQEGMHCIGCPSSIGESLEEACMVHGLDVNVVLADIHHYEETKNQK